MAVASEGQTVEFNKVLLVDNEGSVQVGAPAVEGAKVVCEVVNPLVKGEIFVLYGVWYGVERMVVEGMRTDSLYIGSTSIRVSQVLSAAFWRICSALPMTV